MYSKAGPIPSIRDLFAEMISFSPYNEECLLLGFVGVSLHSDCRRYCYFPME